jgi:two-component system LytT family response regulator
MTLRCLVVDDEPLGRERVATILASLPDVDVVGQCADGAEALEAVSEFRPDLLLLDIQMPEFDGFTLLAAIPLEARPDVIFITGHDQYAVRAFEVHAQDYVLKPFDRDRLIAAVTRVASRRRQQGAGESAMERLQALIDDIDRRRTRRTRLAIPIDGAMQLLPVTDIDWIESSDNNVVIHAGGRAHRLRQTLQSVEASLHPVDFVRVHRRAIVNVARIREIRDWAGGEYLLVLKDGSEIRSSRSYRARLEALLG